MNPSACPVTVAPAKAGTQRLVTSPKTPGPGLRRSDEGQADTCLWLASFFAAATTSASPGNTRKAAPASGV